VPVHASDADGDVMDMTVDFGTAGGFGTISGPTSAAGDLSSSLTFTNPGVPDIGLHTIGIWVTTSSISVHITFGLTVSDVNYDPVVTAPPMVPGAENSLVTFGVSATDANGDHVSLSASGTVFSGLNPATFTDNGDNTGTFTWTPDFTQAGTYPVVFTGNDGNGGIGTANTDVVIANTNRDPLCDAGGPYNGVAGGAFITMDGSGSYDPDGTGLTYSWNFGDGFTGNGVAPSHQYATDGTFIVELCVTDGISLPVCCTTTATISPAGTCTLPARVFTVGGDKTINLGAGKPKWCAEVEPIGANFIIDNVTLLTVKLTYNTTSIFAMSGKTAVDGDKDHNQVNELSACFTKTDLQTLFASLPNGNHTVTVTVSGDLDGGAGTFCGDVSVAVKKGGGGALAASSVSPNPLNPRATLTFTISKPGTVKVEMFDIQGRLVRTIMEETYMMAGTYDRAIDGRGQGGMKLASGVYYVRGVTPDGTFKNMVTILK